MTEIEDVHKHIEFYNFLVYRLVVPIFKTSGVMTMLIDDVMEVLTVSPSKRHPPKLKKENHWFIQQKIKQEQIRLSPVILVFLNSDSDCIIPRIKR